MVFAPVSEEIREKVISYHLAGHGRNAIDRTMNEQGKTVSHSSISNIIARYRREQSSQAPQVDPSISKTIQIDNNVDPSPSPHGVELVDNSSQEIDFADQAYESASEALLSGEYNPALDGEQGERLLGFEQVDISDSHDYSHVTQEAKEIKEPSTPTVSFIRMVGYCLYKTWIWKSFLLFGRTSFNGKGVMLSVIEALNRFAIADLYGKFANIFHPLLTDYLFN
jgi:hypothetical protein